MDVQRISRNSSILGTFWRRLPWQQRKSKLLSSKALDLEEALFLIFILVQKICWYCFVGV